MPVLDLYTIMLMTTLTCGAMSIVMFALYRSFRREVHGIGHWSLGLLMIVIAALLFGFRGNVPGGLAMLAANGVLLGGVGMSMIGTEKFFGQAPSWRMFALAWIAGLLGCAWWLLVRPDFAARMALFSLLAGGFYTRQAVLAVRHGEPHFASYFFGLMMGAQAVLVLARALLAIFNGAVGVDLPGGTSVSSFYLAAANFMSLLLAVSFITLATRRLQTILERRSTHDPLTQVLNRRGFGDIYLRERAGLRRKGQPMTLMSIDLDFFKSINDRFGHAMGDRVLVHVATVIRGVLRESDFVARFGGEEFVVLLPEMELESALGVAERICAALREPSNAGLPRCTASIGAACQRLAQEELDQLLSRTDAALYRAKENGRDRVERAAEASPVPMPVGLAAG